MLIAEIKKEMSELEVAAIGTNSAATAAMKKAGASKAATGENAIVVSAGKAKVIAGPIGRLNSSSAIFSVIGRLNCGIFHPSLA